MSLEIAALSFSVAGAKEVSLAGIDPELSERISVGVGSDILSHFVWTVDYKSGLLWVPAGEEKR